MPVVRKKLPKSGARKRKMTRSQAARVAANARWAKTGPRKRTKHARKAANALWAKLRKRLAAADGEVTEGAA